MQVTVWRLWEEFWGEWVPRVTKGEPFAVVNNGDSLDGVHHNSVTQITQNLKDQRKIAAQILKPVVAQCEGRYYHVRGTEAHGGQSGQDEEELATRLGAIQTPAGLSARDELRKWIGGEQDGWVHFLHHIGTTSSAAYESTAVAREMTTAYVEAGRWRDRPPQCIVRSHRHRHVEVRLPEATGYAIGFTTPGWQLKTPLTFRIAGARQSQPQFGGSLIRRGDEELHTRHKVWRLDPPDIE
jgi:hypothetical protein